jgi:hypothetical protein
MEARIQVRRYRQLPLAPYAQWYCYNLVFIFVDYYARTTRADRIYENVLFLQKHFQIPNTFNHLATLFKPTDCLLIFWILQASWDFQILIEVGKVVTQPLFAVDGNSVAISKPMRGYKDSSWATRLMIRDYGLKSEIHGVALANS